MDWCFEVINYKSIKTGVIVSTENSSKIIIWYTIRACCLHKTQHWYLNQDSQFTEKEYIHTILCENKNDSFSAGDTIRNWTSNDGGINKTWQNCTYM